MRLWCVGTGPFAVPMMRDLAVSEHKVLGLVTKSVGDSTRRKGASNPMRDAARELQLPILETTDINAAPFLEVLREPAADLLVVCDFGQLLSPQCLATTRRGAINLHGSLLPKFRGAAPIQRALSTGESETGVSVILLTPRLDAGPILTRRSTAIGDDETAIELEGRLAELGREAVREALALIASWDGTAPLGALQDESSATRARRIAKEEGRVDWSRPAVQLARQVRAFQPWPGSYTELQRRSGPPLRVILHKVRVLSRDAEIRACQQDAGAAPGTVIDASPTELVVACGAGALVLERIQPAGKREMSTAEFLRGNPVRAGDTFR